MMRKTFYAACNSFAVVGSSGSLLEAEFGREIDAQDVVIRFNNAPSEAYESFVGSRTDVRILNSHAIWLLFEG